MTKKGIIIYIDEEYGYRYWKWNTGLSADKFLEWWKNLETVDTFFFDPGKTLPFGTAKQVSFDDFVAGSSKGGQFLHLHIDMDSFYQESNDSVHFHKGYNPCDFSDPEI